MQDLLAFFLRFGGLFTFVVLEAICALLIVRYNDDQRAIWLHSGNQLSGAVASRADALTDYISLREVADSLAAENARLRLQLLLQPGAFPDSAVLERIDSSFTLVPTRIVRNSVSGTNNTLTLDRGATDGILPRQGVISGRSIVGITRNVGDHYTEVLSVLHSESRISAGLRKAGYTGVMRWGGKTSREMLLNEIPRHARLSKGDTVETTGYSAIFPRGLPIGIVDSFWIEPGSNFYNVSVRLGHDPANLDYAYAIRYTATAPRKLFEQLTSDAR